MIVGPHGFGFITGFAGTATASYADEVNADSPLIYYRFEETSGTPVDETGFSSISSTTGSPDLNQSGLNSNLGSAVRFSGSDWYFIDKTASQLNIDGDKPRTIEAWIYPEAFDNDGAFWDFGGDGDNEAEDFALKVEGTDNEYKLQRWFDDVTFSVSGTKNQWNHVVVTYDGSGTVEIWFNKTKEVSASRTFNTLGSREGVIGHWEDKSSGVVGRVDELAVYDKVLSNERIQAHYDAGVGN